MRIIRAAGQRFSSDTNNYPTMHETKGEWRLASGRGGLIKWSGKHVQVTGEKPETPRGRGRGRR